MKFYKIKALVLQELFITRHSMEVIVDLFYFSIITAVTFGFFTSYLTGNNSSPSGKYLYLGMILMEVLRVAQYTVTMNAMWNIWSKNLANMFIAPLSLKEYLTAQMLSSLIKACVILFLVSAIAKFMFHFDLFVVGPFNLAWFFINLVIFAWSVGVFILALIFRFGTRIQSLAWGLIFLFQPLMATFFPVSFLPNFLQKIAYCIPPTYVFEGARAALFNPAVNFEYMFKAFGLNIIYLALSLWFFNKMFNKSKESGQFARNEG